MRYLKSKFTGVYEVSPAELADIVYDLSVKSTENFFESFRNDIDKWAVGNKKENVNDFGEQLKQMFVIELSLFLYAIPHKSNPHLVVSSVRQRFDEEFELVNFFGPASSKVIKEFDENLGNTENWSGIGGRFLKEILGGDDDIVMDSFLIQGFMMRLADRMIYTTKAVSLYKIMRN